MKFYTMLLFITISRLNFVNGKIVVVQIENNFKWFYLGQFQFHPTNGRLDVDFQVNDIAVRFSALNRENWNEFKTNVDDFCTRPSIKFNETTNRTDHFVLSTSFTWTGPVHFLLQRCNSSLTTFNLSLRLLLTNGNDIFTRHFSNEERGSFELFIVSTCLFTIFVFVLLRFSYKTKTFSCLIIKLFLTSMLSSWMNSLMNLIYFSIYASTGSIETPSFESFRILTRFFHYFAQISFLIVLILCAKGYLITVVPFTKNDLIEMTFVILLYFHVQLVLLIVVGVTKNQIFIHEKVVLICESFQLTLFFFTGLWFFIVLISTMKNLGEKLNFFIIFLLWFLANSIIVLLNLLDVFQNHHLTLIRIAEVSVQYVVDIFLMLILSRKTFVLRSRLNQIDVVHKDLNVSSGFSSKEISNSTSNRKNEMTDLYALTHPKSFGPRWLIKSSAPPVRLEPRRDLTFITAIKSSSSVVLRPSI